MKRHDFRLLPIALAAWAAAWVGTSGWRPGLHAAVALVAALTLLGVVAWRSSRRWTAVVLAVLAVTLATSGARVWQAHTSPIAEFAAQGAVVDVHFQVQGEPAVYGDVTVARVQVLTVESRKARYITRTSAVVLASRDAGAKLRELQPGATYGARVKATAAEPTEAEAAVLSLRGEATLLTEPSPLDALAQGMREGLRHAMRWSPEAQAALVPSLVVGDTSGVDDQMRQEFQATGLTHLMAVSGANLTLMLGVLLAAVRAVGVRGWWVRVTALAGVGLFVLVCGPEPSVLRATAMGIVALAATGVSAGSRSIGALCLAISALMWCDPWLARSVGFALSVSACAGIVLLGPTFRAALARWCPRWIAEALAVSLAAQLVTQPIVTAISGQVSVVGVFANVVAGVFIGPTTVLGLCAAALSWLGPLAAVAGWAAGWASQPVLWIAEFGAGAPAATWAWPPHAVSITALVVCVAISAWALCHILRTALGGALLVAILIVAALVRPMPLGWPGDWSIAFCDVGQGDATVIRAGPGAAILVDAGPEPGLTLGCLADLGVHQVPLLILTHYHADHVGGAQGVVTKFAPRLVLVRGGAPPAWLESLVVTGGGRLRATVPGESVQVGEAQWITVAAPAIEAVSDDEGEGEGAAENDASVVGVAETRGVRVLLAGDAEPPGQAAALRTARTLGLPLAVDVLKLPHHGSARQDERFFASSDASLAVASAGENNSYGHPAQAAIDLATRHSMTVARTDLQGTIAVQRTGERLEVASRRRWSQTGG